MKNSFLLLSKAQKEVVKSWEWYEEKETGLGDRFKLDVAEKIKSVVENPLFYPIKGKYREANTNVFPYLIVFSFDENESLVTIISIFFTSRHPSRKYRKV